LTTEKKLKRQKLRNAEYYDFQAIQDELYEQSKRNKVFTPLPKMAPHRIFVSKRTLSISIDPPDIHHLRAKHFYDVRPFHQKMSQTQHPGHRWSEIDPRILYIDRKAILHL